MNRRTVAHHRCDRCGTRLPLTGQSAIDGSTVGKHANECPKRTHRPTAWSHFHVYTVEVTS